jgi:hypothetical protein
MRYLVKYKYYGKEKKLYKNFSDELERDRYKKWIKNQKGFTNVRFYINKGTLDEGVLMPKKKTVKDNLHYKLVSNKNQLKFNYYVYCLINKNKIVYIGRSTNVINRIKQHISENVKIFDSWNIVKKLPYGISADELLDYESYYIKLFTPKYNIQHNKNICK